MSDLEIHPVALIYPMMPEEELAALAEDIKANGLIDPITLYRGQVLDGRNRLIACKRVGVEPRFITVNGEIASPVLYAVSKNDKRRHMTISQRACIAAEIVPLYREETRQRQATSTGGASPVAKRQLTPETGEAALAKGTASQIAAKAMGVGKTVVESAMAVKRIDPKAYEKVKSGEVTVQAAYDEMKAKSNKRRIGWQKGSSGRPTAPAQKKKMEVGLSHIRGLCRGLDSLDVALATSACSSKEIKAWAQECRALARALRNFANKLTKGSTK